MRLLHLCLTAMVLFPSSLALAQTPAPVPRAKPENNTPALYRFRNKSGKRGDWHDEKGRVAEIISQRKLNSIAAKRGEQYHKGDWITVTLAEIGLDERLTRPDIDPRPDWIYIGTFPETKQVSNYPAPSDYRIGQKGRGSDSGAPPDKSTADTQIVQDLGPEVTSVDNPLPNGIIFQGGRINHSASLITGIIRNASGSIVPSMSVSMNLYDVEGNLIENRIASVGDIAQGQNWAFRIPVTGAVFSFRVVRVTVSASR